MPPGEIRAILPPDLVRMAPGEARMRDARLAMHRHLVRIDPRVHRTGKPELRFERREDVRPLEPLRAEVNDAIAVLEPALRRGGHRPLPRDP